MNVCTSKEHACRVALESYKACNVAQQTTSTAALLTYTVTCFQKLYC